MLFNSYEFIFVFLPLTICGFWLLLRVGHAAVVTWLVACSLFYYGWWNPAYLPLLVGSVLVNYFLGARIGETQSRGLLAFGVAFNLGLIGYFKYLGFFAEIYSSATGMALGFGAVILPLGISFFTFQQIAYLVDSYHRKTVGHRFLEYALFVTFFPQLIAGPIVHQAEMLAQFRRRSWGLTLTNLNIGITFFAIGLFKKVVIADQIALFSTPTFEAAAAGETISFLEAWGAVLAYSFQIYFDFSGYCDMAIGLGRMFGIRLPINFNSPYKATSIIDFWRRWHMTLSRFLRDYLYYPLGGNRLGVPRRYFNLMVVMLLGGLWHGASWTFLAWGGLHGLFLAVNHLFRRLRGAGRRTGRRSPLGDAAGWLLTFLAVVTSWVLFRAETWDAAQLMLLGMFDLDRSLRVPVELAAALQLPAGWIEALGGELVELDRLPYYGGWEQWRVLVLLLVFVLVLPNTQTWLRRYRPALNLRTEKDAGWFRYVAWRMNWLWAAATSGVLIVAMLNLSNVSEFLYYQF